MSSQNKVAEEIYASFLIGDLEVALNVKSVQEVVNFPESIIKMPLAPDFLIGVFNLRGLIIPIINLKELLHMENKEISTSQKVAIVDYEGARIGLLFDRTSEILRVHEENIDTFKYVDEKSYKVISGALKLDSGKRIIQILNPFSLISIENIPQIIDQQLKIKNERSSIRKDGRKKCISFSVNDLRMGFEISGINEIIKVESIETSAIQDELCLGIVNLRGQIVPVIDCSLLLGGKLSPKKDISESRIIVLKLEKELFGLLVDNVESINSYLHESIMPIPLLNKKRANMFLGCILDGDQKEIILLNHSEILSNEEVLSITQGHSKIYQSTARDTVKRGRLNRNSYISFKLDHLFAVSIGDVHEIINNSDEVITTPGSPAIIKGILNLRGRLVTIIDTRSLYHLTEIKDKSESKILIFDNNGERYGFVVDSIESIVMVDNDSKMKVPSLMVQNVKEKFENDIKEIIAFTQSDNKESVLIILNMEPVIERIKGIAV